MCLALQEGTRFSPAACKTRQLSLSDAAPPVWIVEDLVFFGIEGGLVNSGGQLIGRGDEDMVLTAAARTLITSAVPSSLSSPEEALVPAAVVSFAASCKYKSTKHGLDKMKVIQ